ncbi:LysR family transcriptional regulator, partial [Cupriavidus necator]
MNLIQLKHLIALAETGSFSQAAARLHLTQPALSRSIQALESELGMALV